MYRQRGLRQRPSTFRLDYTHPLAKGLVFAGLGGYNCAGSLMYADSSLYGNHGTLTSMDPATDWVWDATLNRFVLDYDGNNDRVITSICPVTDEPLTIAALYCPTNLTTTAIIASLCKNDQTHYFGIRINGAVAGDPLAAVKVDNSASATLATAGSSVANTWQHGAGVFLSDTSRFAIYNGVPGAEDTTDKSDPSPLTAIGISTRVANLASLPFNGRIADVLVYARALSLTEIVQLADPSNVMLSGLILPPRRKFWSINLSTPSINSKRVMFRW